MSDTPRTELMVERAPIGLRTNVAFEQSCDLCRQLERELNEANKTISLQHELMTTAEKRGVDKAKEELNEAKDRIKRLEEALERLFNLPNDCCCQLSNSSLDAWNNAHEALKAMEAKP